MLRAPRRWKLLFGCVVLAGLMVVCFGAAQADREEGKAVALPAAAAQAINRAFPGATIDEVEIEYEGGVKLYEVELEQGGAELEVTVSPDGIIVEVETEVEAEGLPRAVADAIARATAGATIVELEKEEVHAVFKLVKLETPEVTYGAEFVKDGTRREIEVAADGTVIEEEADEEDEDEEHEDDED